MINDSYQRTEVVVTDVKMPFLSMMVFLIKLSLAAIPAAIILTVIYGIFASFFFGLISGLIGG